MNNNGIQIKAEHKLLAFEGTANQAINFIDKMQEGDYAEYCNDITDFMFSIERSLQDAGVYDEHFNLIDDEDTPDLYSGVLRSGAEVMLRENGDYIWTVDVRDRNDEYILGHEYCDYDQAVRKYNKLVEYYHKYPFVEGELYWTIGSRYDVCESMWDNNSEEHHDECSHQVYYNSENQALQARKNIIINFLIDEKNACSVQYPINIYNRIIDKIKKDEIVA